jgi:hypothetical protein
MLCVQPLELRFEVLEAVSVQIEVCGDVAPHSSLYRWECIGGMCRLLHTLAMEAVAL